MPDNVKATVYVNPREISKAVGNHRKNIIAIQREKNSIVKIAADKDLAKREVKCVCF